MTKEELYGGKKEKPRICEVLGVEVGEVWTIRDWIGNERFRFKDEETIQRKYEDGNWKDTSFMGNTLIRLINSPEDIIHNPRWTEEVIDEMPAADVAPVRHGEWHLHDGGKAAECSLCSHVERVRGRSLAKDEWRKYSPFRRLCGAKMDGGASHE